jgi:hypothetical protein
VSNKPSTRLPPGEIKLKERHYSGMDISENLVSDPPGGRAVVDNFVKSRFAPASHGQAARYPPARFLHALIRHTNAR